MARRFPKLSGLQVSVYPHPDVFEVDRLEAQLVGGRAPFEAKVELGGVDKQGIGHYGV